MNHFDEKTESVVCETNWGNWSQTANDVTVEVHLAQQGKSKDLKIDIKNRTISVTAFNTLLFGGELFQCIHADESTWSLEDNMVVRIFLSKTKSGEVWKSLLDDGQYGCNVDTLLKMKKQNDLEGFQTEYPGMDFSRAKLQKTYDKL